MEEELSIKDMPPGEQYFCQRRRRRRRTRQQQQEQQQYESRQQSPSLNPVTRNRLATHRILLATILIFSSRSSGNSSMINIHITAAQQRHHLLRQSQKQQPQQPQQHHQQRKRQLQDSSDSYCGIDWMDAFRNCHEPCPSGTNDECSVVGHQCLDFTGCAKKAADAADAAAAAASDGGTAEITAKETETPTKSPTTNSPTPKSITIRATDAPSTSKSTTTKPASGGMQNNNIEPVSPTAVSATTSKPTRKNQNNNNNNNNNNGSNNGKNDNTVSNPPKAPPPTDNQPSTPQTTETTTPNPPSTATTEETAKTKTSKPTQPQPTTAPTPDPNRPHLQIATTITKTTTKLLQQSSSTSTSSSSSSSSTTTAALSSSLISLASSQAYGTIFDIETTASSPALIVKGLEFYLVLPEIKEEGAEEDRIADVLSSVTIGGNNGGGNGNNNKATSAKDGKEDGNSSEGDGENNGEDDGVIQYEVYTKEGSWHGFEGQLKSFQLVAKGNITATTTYNNSNNNSNNNANTASKNNNNNINSKFKSTIMTYPLSAAGTASIARIPFANFKPIKLNGNSTRQSFYVTLSSKHLLYQRTSSAPIGSDATTIITTAKDLPGLEIEEDAIALASTPELTIYEGAAVMTHPFDKAILPIFYRYPRGFLGGIWYDRDACVESGVVSWEECGADDDAVGGGDNTRPPVEGEESSVVGPVGNMILPVFPSSGMSTSDDGNANDNGGDGDGSNATAANNNQPSLRPTSASPTLSSAPTIDTMKIYLVLTLDNIGSDRIMNKQEQLMFNEEVLMFYRSLDILELNEVDVYGVKIWYQQVFITDNKSSEDDDDESKEIDVVGENDANDNSNGDGAVDGKDDVEGELGGIGDGLDDTGDNENDADNWSDKIDANDEDADGSDADKMEQNDRLLQQDANTVEGNNATKVADSGTMEEEPPAISLEVTIIVSILYSPLPQQITQDLLNTQLAEKGDQFFQSLNAHSAYFKKVDSISSILSVDKVTLPPTMAPTVFVTPAPTIYVDHGPAISPRVQAFLIIGGIWTFLTICSCLQLRNARDSMREENQINKLVEARNVVGNDMGGWDEEEEGSYHDKEVEDSEEEEEEEYSSEESSNNEEEGGEDFLQYDDDEQSEGSYDSSKGSY